VQFFWPSPQKASYTDTMGGGVGWVGGVRGRAMFLSPQLMIGKPATVNFFWVICLI
jgi:hypothetical protein